MIDKTAIIHPSAQIAPDAIIGPYVVIGEGVKIVAPDNIIELIQTKIKELDKQYLSE